MAEEQSAGMKWESERWKERRWWSQESV